MRWLLALCFLASGVCDARTFAIDDLLKLESYGQVVVARKARLVLVEHRRPFDSATDYSYGYLVRRLLSRIETTSLDHPGRLVPLFDQTDGAGYWMGSLSPGGRRLTVFRLKKRHLSIGIVDLDVRTVRWLAVTPDLPLPSPAPIWIDDDRLALVTIPSGTLPFVLSLGNANQTDLGNLWARAARGQSPSATDATTRDAAPRTTLRSLVEIDLRTLAIRTLMQDDIVDVELSPGAGTFAVVLAGQFRRPPSTPIGTSFIGRRHNIVLVDRRTGAAIPILGDYLPGFLRWSPDGAALLGFQAGRDFEHGRFVKITSTGVATTLAPRIDAYIRDDQSGIIVQAGWAGSSIIALLKPGSSRAWMRIDGSPQLLSFLGQADLVGATADALWFLDGGHVVRLDALGVRTTMASKVDRVGAMSLDPFSIGYRHALHPSGAVPFVVNDGNRGTVGLLPDHLQVASDLPAGSDILAGDTETAVVLDTDDNGVSTLRLHRGRSSVVIGMVNAFLAGIEHGRAMPITRSSAEGPLTDWLLLPSTAGQAPMIVIPYPGMTFDPGRSPLGDPSSGSVPTNVHVLLAHGYAVLLPSIPKAPPGEPAAGLAATVGTATDAAVATGHIDGTRVGVLGHSFGAFAAMSIAAAGSARYRAIITSSGPYDLAAAHGMMAGADRIRLSRGLPFDSSAGWTENGQAQMRATPDHATSAYISASPIFEAGKVRVPVMLVHGDLDTVAIDQAERMFMELARNDADASLIRYWGEGHVLASPANIRDYWGRVIAFLDAHLNFTRPKPAPMPRNSPASPGHDSPD